MKKIEFNDYTERLRTSLESRDDVVGLVVLGSTADPALWDEWSDHDFWVITKPGAQDSLAEDLSWLPEHQNIAISITHRPHGRTMLFRNRHKVEFAVFDVDEMRSRKVDRYRILIDRDQIAELIKTVHEESLKPARTRSETLENLCLLLWSACERHYRGELLSARQYLDAFAVNQLLSLLSDSEPGDALKDALDPRRRLEMRSPSLAAELLTTLSKPVPEAALLLVQLVERELKPRFPTLAWDRVNMVRGWITEPT
ncbi:MAG TPA: aminoglycoside 6-adenylyltransferase [Pyrinomonadaceae bacterium]